MRMSMGFNAAWRPRAFAGAAGFLLFATTLSAAAAAPVTVHDFNNVRGESSGPLSTLLLASDGNLYTTTEMGGNSNACRGGCGAVLRITPAGAVTLIHSFNQVDGQFPIGGLVEGPGGVLFGTTLFGGTKCYQGSAGCGTIFSVKLSNGEVTLLHAFDNTAEGFGSWGRLVLGSDGYLWGTTSNGGQFSSGTVFKVSTSGAHSLVYSFPTSGGGRAPMAGLIVGADGAFYGTTGSGGSYGKGTIFRTTYDGTTTVQFSFGANDGGNGQQPRTPVTLAPDGALYGVTEYGGPSSGCGALGCGVLFRYHPVTGSYSVLHNFENAPGNGANPTGAVILNSEGDVLLTTPQGGKFNAGVLATLKAGGAFSVLHDFARTKGNGANPAAGLTMMPDGSLFGGTILGGRHGWGTAFRYTP